MSTLEKLDSQLRDHIVRQDRKDDERAARAGRWHNPNALALMLRAADEAKADVLKESVAGHLIEGIETLWLKAVMDHFTATRTMHTFLKKIDARVEVNRGHWEYLGQRWK